MWQGGGVNLVAINLLTSLPQDRNSAVSYRQRASVCCGRYHRPRSRPKGLDTQQCHKLLSHNLVGPQGKESAEELIDPRWNEGGGGWRG